MRVLIDAINDNARIRGPDRYLLGLLQGLAKEDRQSEYVVLYAPWQTHYEALRLPENFRFVCCAAPRHRVLRVLWHALRFSRFVRSARADLLHLPNIILVCGLRVPTLMTVHDLAHFRYPEKFGHFRGYAQRLLIRWAVRQTDRIVAVSDFTRQDLMRLTAVPRSKIAVIGEGGPEPRDLPRRNTARPYFLYLGQLERSKNVEALVTAFARSRTLAEAEAELRIAGTPGNAAGRIAALAQRLAPGRVHLLGYVSEDSLPQLYANALAFVFPSLIEGFGLVLLEAMAYGTPVIASNSSVIPEVVGDAGLLVDASDLAALQCALERVMCDPALRQSLIQRGRERLARFSWQRVAQQTLEEYRRLAD